MNFIYQLWLGFEEGICQNTREDLAASQTRGCELRMSQLALRKTVSPSFSPNPYPYVSGFFSLWLRSALINSMSSNPLAVTVEVNN